MPEPTLLATDYSDHPNGAFQLRTGHKNLASRPAAVVTSRYVLLPLAHLITGYSVKAMHRKIERGDWIEDREYIRAPDGHILLDLVGYERWAARR